MTQNLLKNKNGTLRTRHGLITLISEEGVVLIAE